MTEPVNRTPLIVGFLIAGSVLLGLSLFKQRADERHARPLPVLDIVAGTSRNTQDSAVVRFVTDGALALHHNGWMADNLHPHLQLGTVPLMAGAQDIFHIAADTFGWRVRPGRTGDIEIHLFWANLSHVPVGDSASAILRIEQ